MSSFTVICSSAEVTQARNIFTGWLQEKQLALFKKPIGSYEGESLIIVVHCLYPAVEAFPDNEQRKAVAKAMSCALADSGVADSERLRAQIDYTGACPKEHNDNE